MTHTTALLAVLLAWLALGTIVSQAAAEDEKFNYDEAKVPPYTLPDPLKMQDGRDVTSAQMWRDERRPELLELFRSQVYGRQLARPEGLEFQVEESTPDYLRGKGKRKDVRLLVPADNGKHELFRFALFVPNSDKPVPAFVGILLCAPDANPPVPGVALKEDVGRPLPGDAMLDVILDRGYALATIDPATFCPDDKARFREGVLTYFHPDRTGPLGSEEGGAISTWAWALSRALDYFEQDPTVDAKRAIVIGHSRRGKTALWAGAEDPRFAVVISNDSGCGGAALSRRIFGETVNRINNVFPHWFCGNFKKYNNRENELPVDQHELVALIAPRPVYVGSAVDDGWADPKGEFLSALHAEPVYRLFGLKGLGTAEQPPLNESAGDAIGYHVRSGKHALADFDWLLYLDFVDRHLKTK